MRRRERATVTDTSPSRRDAVATGTTEPADPTFALPAGSAANPIGVRALLLGERLDTRGLEKTAPLATAPLAVAVPGGGTAVLFRYGAVVVFGAKNEPARAGRGARVAVGANSTR